MEQHPLPHYSLYSEVSILFLNVFITEYIIYEAQSLLM